MSRQKLSQQVMWAILMMLLFVGCGAPSASPTSGPLPESVTEWIEVTFDGNECTVSGPTELTTGDQSFILNDLSDKEGVLLVSRLLDGKTFQDILDYAREPYVWRPTPSWVEHQSQLGAPIKANGGEVWTIILRKEGEHFIYIERLYPFGIWICAPLWVIEAPSE